MAELFPGQASSEQIYLVIREHWFYLAAHMIIWFIFALALVAFDHFLPIYIPAAANPPYNLYISLGKDIYLVFLVLGVFMSWVMYHVNFKVITDQRVVDITHDTVFSHTISELGLEKIEDVTSETTGFFGSIFGYGNVYIQTAGREERFTFKSVPDPDKVERLILNLYSKRRGEIPKNPTSEEEEV